MIVATVVIPAYGRPDLLQRAVDSVIKQRGSDKIQIIIIDDNSPIILKPNNLRNQDCVIRAESCSGAAVSRNVGIANANADWIYLLDSDDYFINIDLDNVSDLDADTLYYRNIATATGISDFKSEVKKSSFPEMIFCKQRDICQTSSLLFNRRSGAKFDESLPKHQDWDFVYFEFLAKNRCVKKLDGLVFFDKGDKTSLSRKKRVHKSLPWLSKIQNEDDYKNYVELFKLKMLYIDKEYKFTTFIKSIIKCLSLGQLSFRDLLVLFYKRYILK